MATLASYERTGLVLDGQRAIGTACRPLGTVAAGQWDDGGAAAGGWPTKRGEWPVGNSSFGMVGGGVPQKPNQTPPLNQQRNPT